MSEQESTMTKERRPSMMDSMKEKTSLPVPLRRKPKYCKVRRRDDARGNGREEQQMSSEKKKEYAARKMACNESMAIKAAALTIAAHTQYPNRRASTKRCTAGSCATSSSESGTRLLSPLARTTDICRWWKLRAASASASPSSSSLVSVSSSDEEEVMFPKTRSHPYRGCAALIPPVGLLSSSVSIPISPKTNPRSIRLLINNFHLQIWADSDGVVLAFHIHPSKPDIFLPQTLVLRSVLFKWV